MKTNGTALREARERKFLTLRELAEHTGVTAATINRLENGLQVPRMSTIRKLAVALQVDPESLMLWESGDVSARS